VGKDFEGRRALAGEPNNELATTKIDAQRLSTNNRRITTFTFLLYIYPHMF